MQLLNLSDNVKIGILLVTLGGCFLALGVLLFFDAGLLTIGARDARQMVRVSVIACPRRAATAAAPRRLRLASAQAMRCCWQAFLA
jgi:hypothetical protein